MICGSIFAQRFAVRAGGRGSVGIRIRRSSDLSSHIRNFFVLASIFLTGCASVQIPAGSASAPVIEIEQGALRGQSDGSVAIFKGIPYASPPVGQRRWQAPEPPAAWDGTRDATEFGAACIQPEIPAVSIYNDPPKRMSEDCLTLNVWAPASAENAPVIVWIHGGSLRIGGSGLGMYDGTQFARRGIVFISVNYRLGALGWLAHDELSRQSPEGVSGNYGLLDQMAALRWARENAGTFGGNAGNITIMGESAGALSATYLLASPRANKLFEKAIIQSPNSRAFPELSKARFGIPSAEATGAKVLKTLGAASIEEARAMAPEKVDAAAAASGFMPQGTIDGTILPRQIPEIFDRGEQAKVPVVVGFNSGEVRSQRIFLPRIPNTEADYVAAIERGYGDLSRDYVRQYPADDMEQSMLDALTQGIYGWAAERIAKRQAGAGVDAYLYVFDHCYPAASARDLCAFHASELPFVFGNLESGALPDRWPVPDGASDAMIANAMIDYWTSFAREGRPHSNGNADWLPYADGQAFMKFSDRPVAGRDAYPGMFELHEAFFRQRRDAGEHWGLQVGIAAGN